MSEDIIRARAVHQIYLGVDDVVEPGTEFDCPSEVAESLRKIGAIEKVVPEAAPEPDDVI